MSILDQYSDVLLNNTKPSANKDWTFELVTIAAAAIMLAGVAISSLA